jgi:hypothetical protein
MGLKKNSECWLGIGTNFGSSRAIFADCGGLEIGVRKSGGQVVR